MKSRHLFDDLKEIGKKEYNFRNGEEEWRFFSNDLEIEIYKSNNVIDLAITHNSIRCNYFDSQSLSDNQKRQLYTLIHSYISLDLKCKEICKILLEAFIKK